MTLKCDVCPDGEAIGVASCSFGAMSLAYCQECVNRGAEPGWAFTFLLNDVAGGDPARLDPSVMNMVAFIDGRYMTFKEWLDAKRGGSPGQR